MIGVILATALIAPPRVSAGDWPQILGPDRNGVAHDERIVDRLPGSLAPDWTFDVGSGVAGPAVANGRVYIFHRRRDEELIEALDAGSGAAIWKASFATQYVDSILGDDGPRCVPVVSENRVFLHGANGSVHCVAADTGKTVWSRPAAQEFNAPKGYFGAGSAPIVVGDKLLVNVGGRKGGIVAFAADTGKPVWTATSEEASYSAPTLARVEDAWHVIFATRLKALCVDPETGTVRWEFPFGARGPTVNAATPVVMDNHVFLTASYGIGASWIRMTGKTAHEVYSGESFVSSQYVTPVTDGKAMYGIDGRDDGPASRLVCFDPETRKEFWSQRDFGTAALIAADGKLLAWKTSGRLAMIRHATQRFESLGEVELMEKTCRALPALSNGRLYVRNGERLACFMIGSK
jgi:outer membrane protein assembly factor BamB